MAYDPIDGYVVLFGGFGNGSPSPYSDTWTYSDGHWNQISGGGPPARYAAMMTWDGGGNQILLFGGYDSATATYYNDTWSFLHGTWTQLNPVNSPPVRWRAAMAYDAKDNYTVLFGGTPNGGTTAPMHDTWTFANGNWQNITLNVSGNPAARFRQDMTYDAADGYLVMFGGCTLAACASQDTLTYSNLTWKLLTLTTKPSTRAYMGLTFDAAQGYVLLFAGDDYVTSTGKSDTWKFLQGNWTDLSLNLTTHPSTRAFEMLAYDGFDGYSVLFGGQNPPSTFLNDTWAYGPSVIGHFAAAPTPIDLTQSVTFNATPLAFAGYTIFNYSGLPPGCVSANVSVLTCTPTAPGSFNVSVKINDSSGAPTTKNATVLVNPDLNVTGAVAAPTTVTAGTRFRVNVTAVNGTAPYSYSYSGLPAPCGSGNTASLACTPTATGTFTITATVTDAVGWRGAMSVSVTVNPSPSLPALAAQPTTIDQGEHFTLWANATGGTAPLTYTYTGLPVGCTTVSAPTLSCTPSTTGVSTIHVNVTDAFGWTVTASITITVNPAPAISGFAVSPGSIDLGQPVTFWLNATGGTGRITLGYSGMPAGCNLGRLATGQCTPTANGTFVITGSATDARGISASQTVTLQIASDPSVDSVVVSPTRIDAGQNVTITTSVSGGTAPISYSYTGLPTVGCVNATSAVVTCRPRTAAVYTIVVVATDAFHLTSQLGGATLSVSADPAITAFAASVSTVTVGTATVLQVTVSGGSGPYSFVYTHLPAGCTTANRSSLSWTPTQTGTFNVTVKATDAQGLSATSWTTFVVEPASAGPGFLGLSGSTGYAVLALIVIVVLVAVIAGVLMMRRRRTVVVETPQEWSEGPSAGDPPAE